MERAISLRWRRKGLIDNLLRRAALNNRMQCGPELSVCFLRDFVQFAEARIQLA